MLTSSPARSNVTPIASNRTVRAYGRAVCSLSQRRAVARTFPCLTERSASNGCPEFGASRLVFTSQNASV